MLGRSGEARAILAAIREELAERGANVQRAVLTGIESANVELWAGDHAAAAELAAEGCRQLEELEEAAFLSTSAATYAVALYELDRLDDADAWAKRAAELGASDDMFTQILWRQTSAKVLGRRGQLAEAEQLARDAVAIAEGTDYIEGQGYAYVDLADVLVLARKPAEAVAALEQALERYERKGNVVSAQRTRERLAELATPV
jgi:tetratricopeptide (TPR) repeat protein